MREISFCMRKFLSRAKPKEESAPRAKRTEFTSLSINRLKREEEKDDISSTLLKISCKKKRKALLYSLADQWENEHIICGFLKKKREGEREKERERGAETELVGVKTNSDRKQRLLVNLKNFPSKCDFFSRSHFRPFAEYIVYQVRR